MIASVSLKTFRFRLPETLMVADVIKLLSVIEAGCKITKNRLSLAPENTGDYNSPYPINLTNPPGVLFLAQEPSSIEGKFSSETALTEWKQSAPSNLLALSQFGRILIGGSIPKFGRTFEAKVYVQAKSVNFALVLKNMGAIESERKIELFHKMASWLRLPIDCEPKAVSDVVKLEHKQNLNAQIGGLEKGERYAYLTCDLTNNDYPLFFQQIIPLWKFKSMYWHFGTDAKFPFNEDVDAVNRVNFPTAHVRLNYWWHLQSYKDVNAMPAMASLSKMDVAQSMFEFEFDNGLTGQLDIAANQKGKFRLIFSFDQKEAANKFSSLLSIKLEPGL